MSIKDFHKIFILASIILCGYFGAWAWGRYSTHNTLNLLITALISFGLCAALIVYGIYFLKKARSL
jgi:hypothetical protein